MSRWFNCVKLPPDVIEEDHPFHVLFAQEKPGHLFLARWDGSERQDLSGEQSRTELWDHMETFLASEYEKGDKRADSSLKELLKLLDRFDRIDSDIALLKEQVDEQIEKGNAGSRKFKKLQHRLDSLTDEKARAREKALEISELELKQPEVGAKPSAAGSGSG